MTTSIHASVKMQDNLSLSYDQPLPVPTNFSAVCDKTAQATSILQVQNLSTSNVATFFVNAGDTVGPISIPANTPAPWAVAKNFGGAKLVVSNISSASADILVTLRST